MNNSEKCYTFRSKVKKSHLSMQEALFSKAVNTQGLHFCSINKSDQLMHLISEKLRYLRSILIPQRSVVFSVPALKPFCKTTWLNEKRLRCAFPCLVPVLLISFFSEFFFFCSINKCFKRETVWSILDILTLSSLNTGSCENPKVCVWVAIYQAIVVQMVNSTIHCGVDKSLSTR